MQADTEYDGVFTSLVPIGICHGLLELDGSTQRIDGAEELNQGAVARELDQAAAVAGQYRLKALLAMLPKVRQRAALVPAYQAGIADHIGCDDCRQSALLTGQWIFIASPFRIVV